MTVKEQESTVFKYLDKETAIKALKMYLKGSRTFKPDLQKLKYYSENIKKNVSDYILGIIT